MRTVRPTKSQEFCSALQEVCIKFQTTVPNGDMLEIVSQLVGILLVYEEDEESAMQKVEANVAVGVGKVAEVRKRIHKEGNA